MNQTPQNNNIAIIVAVITGVFVCAAAAIGLGAPFTKNLADRYIPTFTPVPTQPVSIITVQETSTPVNTEIPNLINTPVVDTSNAPAQIASTAIPTSLGTITILGNSADGTLFTANQSGSYIIKYIDGAYSTFPVSSQKLWQTSVRIYKNRQVAWNENTIGDFDYNFLAFGEVDSKEQALSNAKGSSIIIKLSQSDYIYLVTVDTKNSYADNPGEVILEILFIP